MGNSSVTAAGLFHCRAQRGESLRSLYMHDGSYTGTERRSEGANSGPLPISVKFAAKVAARLVSRESVHETTALDGLVQRMLDAVVVPDPAPLDALRHEMRRARVSSTLLGDIYIPAAARRLGDAWDDDRLSFFEVTMGVARLQAMLHETEARTGGDHVFSATSGAGGSSLHGKTLLMVLPAGEQHTLGAMVVSNWLRRKDISVCLRIAPTQSELSALVTSRHFDAAMLSASSLRRLDNCRVIIDTLRDAGPDHIPVAIGGPVLSAGGDLSEATAANVVTNDIELACRQLGLYGAMRALQDN